MNPTVAELRDAVAAWRRRDLPRPDLHLVSGSGLAVDLPWESRHRLTLPELLPFPIHAVRGHPLEIELVEPQPGRWILYQRGRLHHYQGLDPDRVVFVVRLARLLGAHTLVMSNAAGGVAPELVPGALVLIRDHLNLMGANPLRGELPEEWGPRFPDLAGAYDPGLRAEARRVAERFDLDLGEGVYAAVPGPSYETPAEVAMLATLGADLVGMSTVLEVIAARQMGMRCLCLSLVSNLAAGGGHEGVDHEEVLAAGRAATDRLARLWAELLPGLAEV